MINIKDILTLSDGNQYGVVNKTTKDNSNIKFCYEDKTSNQIDLIEVNDKNLIENLILSFANNIKNEF